MPMECGTRWLLLLLLVISSCFLFTYGRGGRGGGGRGGGGRSSSSRGSSSSRTSNSRPPPTYNRPAPAPTARPAKVPAATHRPDQGSSNNQPASNPNYKPDGNAPAGPPPPYSGPGQPVPNGPQGPPPSYGQPAYPAGPAPPYSGNPGRPPSYFQPGQNVQTYPARPGSYPNQNGGNRPYPVQPGSYPGSYPSRPYPQQPLGGNVWQPQSGMPAPPYMNHGGLPTGTNMYTKPHKQKGFLGSLMSVGGSKSQKNKYHGSSPNPYGYGGMGHMGGGGMGHMTGVNTFLGKHNSAAMYTILPYMAATRGPILSRPRFGYVPIFLPSPHFHHYHYGHGYHSGHEYAHYYDVHNVDYVGKCMQPLKKENSAVKCKSDTKEIECQSKCDEGYLFSDNITEQSNKCWHITGVWRPGKNFPACTPECKGGCRNGGACIRPDFCKCPTEFRGDRCQFLKSNFLKCDVRDLTKGEKVGWVCTHLRNETTCKIQCNEPSTFESPIPDKYFCTPNGTWTPATLPSCIVKDEENGKEKKREEEKSEAKKVENIEEKKEGQSAERKEEKSEENKEDASGENKGTSTATI